MTRKSIANGVRGLSDRAIAWAFITPTIVLLLAINIFPLFWAVRLSFTNYRANRPNAPLRWLGLEHYSDLLSDPDIWHAMQVTARFVLSTVAIETLLGFALAVIFVLIRLISVPDVYFVSTGRGIGLYISLLGALGLLGAGLLRTAEELP